MSMSIVRTRPLFSGQVEPPLSQKELKTLRKLMSQVILDNDCISFHSQNIEDSNAKIIRFELNPACAASIVVSGTKGKGSVELKADNLGSGIFLRSKSNNVAVYNNVSASNEFSTPAVYVSNKNTDGSYKRTNLSLEA